VCYKPYAHGFSPTRTEATSLYISLSSAGWFVLGHKKRRTKGQSQIKAKAKQSSAQIMDQISNTRAQIRFTTNFWLSGYPTKEPVSTYHIMPAEKQKAEKSSSVGY